MPPQAPKPRKTDVYADRKRYYVPLKAGNKTYNYVFDSPCDAGQLAKLGAKPYADGLTAVIYKANLPKPAKGKTEDNVSSFVASDTILPTGCKLVRPAKGFSVGKDVENFDPAQAGNQGSIVVFVEVQGVKFAWRMPNYQMSALTTADLDYLKIKIPSKTDNNELVLGASVPRPPRAFKKLDGKTVSTFCDESVESGNGWTVSKAGYVPTIGKVATSLAA